MLISTVSVLYYLLLLSLRNFIYVFVNHGSIALLKQDHYASGDANGACLSELVEQIQFLNQASSVYNYISCYMLHVTWV